MKLIFSKRAPMAFAAILAAAAIVSCGDDDPTAPSTPSAIAAATTPAATAQVATAIPGPSVTVTGPGGAPAAGVLVKFDVTAGGGALQYPTATTNEQGVASAGFWQIGPTVGTNTATATVEGLAPLTFSVASTSGPATRISANSGNAQTGAMGATLNPLSVRITDAGGNPKSGETVTFAVTSGGGSLASTTATTNAQGVATSGAWTIGKCRSQTARATSGTLVTNFTAAASGQPAIAPGGNAVGTLDASDCSIGGRFTDEYALTTASEAVNISLTSTFSGVINVSTNAATVPIATSSTGSVKLIAAASTKTLAVTSAAAGETGAYTLGVASTSSNVQSCDVVYIEVGATTTQSISTSDCKSEINGVETDTYMIYIPAGGTVRISMSSNPVDALMRFYSPAGALIVERDNLGVSASSEVITFTASTAGYYKLVATAWGLLNDYHYGAEYGAYTFSVVTP